MQPKIKVLIVDDSSVIRNMLNYILKQDPDFEVVGMAPDPYVAREKLVLTKPDVMILDIEMPKMDGITFLEKVMNYFPTRTLILSSLSSAGSSMALKAFEVGAIDVLEKPKEDLSKSLQVISELIREKVKEVFQARILSKSKMEAPKTKVRFADRGEAADQIIAIASSTGGTEALKSILPKFPADCPGIVIVQHMPPVFTRAYSDKLNEICEIKVKEAANGDLIEKGLALMAPGNFHMEIEKKGKSFFVKLNQNPPLHGVRPAADFLMQSVAKQVGARSVGIVLTGMGKDGARGLLEMKNVGAVNFAQNEESCVVYGMPKVAIEMGAINHVVELSKMSEEVMKVIKRKVAA